MKFEINNEEIWMTGKFTEASALELRYKILAQASNGPDFPIVIYINSYGGEVDALNMIVDTINSIPNKIITVAVGKAMSAGAFLLSCGDMRFAAPNARIMLHSVQGGAIGSSSDIDNMSKEMLRLNENIISLVAKNTKKTPKVIRKMLDANVDKFMSPEEAVAFGLVHKVGVPRLTFNIQFALELGGKR